MSFYCGMCSDLELPVNTTSHTRAKITAAKFLMKCDSCEFSTAILLYDLSLGMDDRCFSCSAKFELFSREVSVNPFPTKTVPNSPLSACPYSN